jgi:magnesium chelatase subunit D
MTGSVPPADASSDVWDDACLIAALVAIDPAGLGGVSLRGGAGPARDRWLAGFRQGLSADTPVRRAPLNIPDDRLLGGLDLAASLSIGRAVAQRGLLVDCDGGVAILAMAERIETGIAGRIAAVLDQAEVTIEREGLTQRWPASFGVVALDEGIEPDERPPAALLERLAFRIDLNGVRPETSFDDFPDAEDVAEAKDTLAAQRQAPDWVVEALCTAASKCGVSSPRGTLLALRAAAVHAALNGRLEISVDDLAAAARLVLAPRATRSPDQEASSQPQPEPQSAPEAGPETDAEQSAEPPQAQAEAPETKDPGPDLSNTTPPSDIAVAAVQAALPQDLKAGGLLAVPARSAPSRARGEGGGVISARRGRPLGSRPGVLRPGDRLDLPQTLRTAAPWQRLRRQALGPLDALTPANDATRIRVRPEDFRIRRFIQPSQSTTIFVVDASGSAALNRLGEAKGAVELLLAKAYVSRTRVALIAFAGANAEVLLAPTRSLTRAKRQLSDLAGGGGTPLASAIDAALALALSERSKDRAPRLVFLTDGRANLGRGGVPGRPLAEAQALEAAAQVRNAGVASVFMDTSPRPQPNGDRFALAMGGLYAPLPYVDASAVFSLVDSLGPARGVGGVRGAA